MPCCAVGANKQPTNKKPPGVKQGEGVKHLVPTRYQSKTIDGDVAAR
jgi:hypothetical protein